MLVILVVCACVLAAVLVDGGERSVRIALLSDTHFTEKQSPVAERYRRLFDQAIEQINGEAPDIAVVAGDLVDDGSAASLAGFKRRAALFRCGYLAVPGNHDVGGKCVDGADDAVTADSVAAYERAMGRSFWAVRAAGLRLIGVNASLLGSGLASEAEQWRFLENELSAVSGRPTALICHYPPFVEVYDEPGDRYWNIEPRPRARLLDLAAAAGVVVVLSGHIHRPLACQYRGMALITTPPVAFGLPVDAQPEGWTLVTISAAGARAQARLLTRPE